jgi:hypothetical protein
MNHIKNTVAAVVATAALSLVAACGELDSSATETGQSVDKSKSPAPKGPTWDHAGRMDFGDGEATLPAKPKSSTDRNTSRLDFGDDGRG